MKATTYIFAVLIGLFVAGVLQASDRWFTVFGARPLFILVFVACMGMVNRPAWGAGAGFLAGIVEGSLAGANLTQYVTSRALTGFCVAWVRSTDLQFGVILAAIGTLLSTLGANAILMIFAPPADIGSFIRATIFSAMYNGVLAMPLFAVLQHFAKPTKV